MSLHIGLIGGIGPAATTAYHRIVVQRFAAAGSRLSLTIERADLGTLDANMCAWRPRRQAEVFARHTERLRGHRQ